MKLQDQYLLEQAYQSIYNRNELLLEGVSEEEIKTCETIIKKLSKGKFKNEPEQTIDLVKKCKNVFAVSQDTSGQYTVVIKDRAVKKIEEMYPELVGKFKPSAECKKDVKACREDKLKQAN